VLVAVNTITVTIVFSIIAHGITARPLTRRYVAALQKADRGSSGLPT
jgi:NhaP-type Na+/H+ or K+/H+ antiporter